MSETAQSALLDRRLLVVTGKGGTGKSTLTAALGVAAAKRGKKVLVCEVVAKERVADLLGKPSSGTEIRELLPNLFSVHVRPREAMRAGSSHNRIAKVWPPRISAEATPSTVDNSGCTTRVR